MSLFFRRFIDEDFFKDLSDEINLNIVSKVVSELNKMKFPKNKYSRNEVINNLKQNFSPDIIINIEILIDSLMLFLQISDDFNEFKELSDKIISKEKNEKKRSILNNFFKSLEYIQDYYYEKMMERNKLKASYYFINIEHICKFKGRFKNEFDYKKNQIENYEPEFYDVVPMVSIGFTISDGEERKNLIFEVDEEELDNIISNLIIAQKELKEMKNKYNIK